MNATPIDDPDRRLDGRFLEGDLVGVRWTSSRSATSSMIVMPISATHAQAGTSMSVNFELSDAVAARMASNRVS